MTDTETPVVLLTGFEPFERAERNPSWDAVAELARTWNGPATLVTARLPVEFDTVGAALDRAIAEHRPDVVIGTGLAEGRTAVSPERVAINVDDARIPDNAGAQPIDRPIDPDGAPAYFTDLPLKRITRRATEAGVPTAVSNTAGTFVCNRLFYEIMLRARRDGFRGGFIHVPSSPESARGDEPTVPLRDIATVFGIAVEETAAGLPDDRLVGGRIH